MKCVKCGLHYSPLQLCICELPKSRGIKNHTGDIETKDNSESGATRNKITSHRHDLLIWEFLDLMASVMAEGVPSHGEDNWKQGFDNPGRDIWNHVHNHHRLYRKGDRSEPHLAKMDIGCMFQWHFDNEHKAVEDRRDEFLNLAKPVDK